MKIKLAIIPIFLVLTGCTIHFMDFSMVSTEPLPIDNKYDPVVIGESCGSVYFSHVEFPSIEKAIQDALNKSRADYLTDVIVYRHLEHYILWVKDCFVAEGKAGGIKPSAVYKRPAAYSPYTTQIRPLPALPSYLLPKSISQ